MAQATWADELAGVAPQNTNEDDELWHVAVAPGEVKILSLERLDDLYRLEIVDDSTLVWQPGMSGWLPLSVVAGGDEEEEPVSTQPVSTQPARSVLPPPSRLPAPPPAPAPPSMRAAPSRPAPPPRPTPPPSRPAPAPSVWPAPVVALPTPSRPPVALATTDAFGLVAQPVPISRPPARIEPVLPATLRPLAVDPIPSFRPAPTARSGGGSLIFLAALAGLVVTLYRNDMVRSAARSAGLESTYLKLEGALGGPSFGTPRALEELRPAVAAAAVEAPTSSPTVTAPTNTAPTATGASESTPHKAEGSAVSLDSLPVESKKAAEAKVATPEAKPAPVAANRPAAPAKVEEPEPKGPLSLDEAIRRASGSKAKPAAANAKTSPASAAKSTPRKRGGTSDYDPMNGKL